MNYVGIAYLILVSYHLLLIFSLSSVISNMIPHAEKLKLIKGYYLAYIYIYDELHRLFLYELIPFFIVANIIEILFLSILLIQLNDNFDLPEGTFVIVLLIINLFFVIISIFMNNVRSYVNFPRFGVLIEFCFDLRNFVKNNQLLIPFEISLRIFAFYLLSKLYTKLSEFYSAIYKNPKIVNDIIKKEIIKVSRPVNLRFIARKHKIPYEFLIERIKVMIELELIKGRIVKDTFYPLASNE